MKNVWLSFSVLLASQLCFAESGSFFNVVSHTTPTGAILSISSTIPNRTYPIAGIKLQSNGYSFMNSDSECSNVINGYCVFSVSPSSPKNISVSGKAGRVNMTLCLNGVGPVSCQNDHVAIQYGYVANDSGQVLLCSIDSNGSLSACFDGGDNGLMHGPNVITFNHTRTKAYVTNSPLQEPASVFLCDVNSNYMLDNCHTQPNTGTPFQVPFGLVLNKAETSAYIPNGSDQRVLICPLNQEGAFHECVDSGNTGTPFAYPLGIVLNHAQTKAYVTNNGSNRVSICPINADGSFGECIDSGNSGIDFVNPQGITLNDLDTIAYITNTGNANSVSICPIQHDGTFGKCVDSGNTFNYPVWIALNSDGTFAYVTNNANSTVSICPLNSDGTFGVCQYSDNSGLSLNGPEGITLNP